VVWDSESKGEVAGQMDTKPMDCGLGQRVKGGEIAGQMDTKPMDWSGSATQRERLLAKWIPN
jgi:hypothetical protein